MKYVALIAFRNIVRSHPDLVAMHQDVILECINDPDISIRLQALELGSGMINMDNIVVLVDRLLQQLRDAPVSGGANQSRGDASYVVEPLADEEDDLETTLHADKTSGMDLSPVPPEYRAKIIRQVLDVCSKDSYANVPDFEWYIDVLVELVRLAPNTASSQLDGGEGFSAQPSQDIGTAIGLDLQNVAVRVSSVRPYATRAAASLVSSQQRQLHFSGASIGSQGVLAYAAWIVGEYAKSLTDKRSVLEALLSPPIQDPFPSVYSAYIQAISKVLAAIFGSELFGWDVQQQTISTLLLARTIHFLESLVAHPNLEVQERAVEFMELLKITKEAIEQHPPDSTEAPYLITHVLPSLFDGEELGPVAATAQRKVPLPQNLDLSTPLNDSLMTLLRDAETGPVWSTDSADSYKFYHERPSVVAQPIPTAITNLSSESNLLSKASANSYQNDEAKVSVPQDRASQLERLQRQRDDPFYIGGGGYVSGNRTPVHDLVRASNGEDMDIDSIPIMDLDLGDNPESHSERVTKTHERKQRQRQRQQVTVAAEETIDDGREAGELQTPAGHSRESVRSTLQSRLLQVDSSGLGGFSLNESGDSRSSGPDAYYRSEAEDAEMAKALAEVERLRMEMQRTSERLHIAEDIPDDGMLVKKKKKKKKKKTIEALSDEGTAREESAVAEGVRKKRKKKKKVAEIAE